MVCFDVYTKYYVLDCYRPSSKRRGVARRASVLAPLIVTVHEDLDDVVSSPRNGPSVSGSRDDEYEEENDDECAVSGSRSPDSFNDSTTSTFSITGTHSSYSSDRRFNPTSSTAEIPSQSPTGSSEFSESETTIPRAPPPPPPPSPHAASSNGNQFEERPMSSDSMDVAPQTRGKEEASDRIHPILDRPNPLLETRDAEEIIDVTE